jgi:hypothetical protein
MINAIFKKHIRLWVIVMTIVLSMAGLSYGAWSGNLSVNGTSATGNLDVLFMPEGQNCVLGASWSNWPVVALTDDNTAMDVNFQGLHFGEGQIPASYESWFAFQVKNYGTVPATVTLDVPGNLPGVAVQLYRGGFDEFALGADDSITLMPDDSQEIWMTVTLTKDVEQAQQPFVLVTLNASQSLDLDGQS